MKTFILIIGISILLVIASIKTTTWVRSPKIPQGQWTVYFVDENGEVLQDVEVELYRSDVMAYQGTRGHYAEEIPFDNFLVEKNITCKTGILTLTNSKELFTFVKGYRLLWLFEVHRGYVFEVVLKAEAKQRKPVLIDYEDICYAEEDPVIITLYTLE